MSTLLEIGYLKTKGYHRQRIRTMGKRLGLEGQARAAQLQGTLADVDRGRGLISENNRAGPKANGRVKCRLISDDPSRPLELKVDESKFPDRAEDRNRQKRRQ
jgi:hypothetical protein